MRATTTLVVLLTALGALVSSRATVAAAGGDLPLIQAAKQADAASLKTLLARGASVDTAEGDGATALHWAVYRDSAESVDVLLAAGAKVNAANDLGATPLWLASQNGSIAMVRRLLQAGANPNLPLIAGETPLMVASLAGSAGIAELLLGKGAEVNARGARGQTALMWAVARRHPAVVRVLLAHHADVDAKSEVWSEVMAVPPHGLLEYNKDIPHGGDTALMFAARVGDLESARLLVAAGAKVDAADAWGVSATTLAAHSGFTPLVEFLLDKGANPNAAPQGFTALHTAIMRRDEALAGTLLAHGADPNARLQTWTPTRRSSRDWNFDTPLVGATPLWLAARFSEPGLVRLLLKHGADPRFVHDASYRAPEPPSALRTQSTTAIMAATGMGGGVAWVRATRAEPEARVLETLKLLIDSGIDVNKANDDGRTALDAARALKYESAAAFLVEHGARPGQTSAR